MAQLVEVTERVFDLPAGEILEGTRHKTTAEARHVVVWLLRERLGWSYPEIGRALRGKRRPRGFDHTTVLSAYRKACRLLAQDWRVAELRDLVESEVRLAYGERVLHSSVGHIPGMYAEVVLGSGSVGPGLSATEATLLIVRDVEARIVEQLGETDRLLWAELKRKSAQLGEAVTALLTTHEEVSEARETEIADLVRWLGTQGPRLRREAVLAAARAGFDPPLPIQGLGGGPAPGRGIGSPA